ncbi:family 10 glycosylhydrolase [Pontibacter sp. G13]|uniref:glycoside hydrolase family 10 protein n=1 Tax=Pontibacter sp. G13 TaxID=3074898 RepID=UPI00288BA78F|nr:family 10 glycosylhydrolase [Pontibacter sp. G13]WNJ16500.1 family 10 glycosylhydrolase [Pontibacter sp. G13]
MKSAYILLLASACLLLASTVPPTDDKPPKREFRAVWVATFHNIDWPSKRGISSIDQRKEFHDLLKYQRANGMNALVVQIRPCGDALYPSLFAPWSEFLSGDQGKAPFPTYDPVEFMVEACHERNMEFHAWLNPFRVVSHVDFSELSDDHILSKHPEWTFQYGKQIYLNPGIPAVRDYLTEVVLEVVRRYDVDGIHFDDYFYPYQLPDQQLPDQEAYAAYGGDFKDIHQWRRHNIDAFIEQISDSLSSAKPHVKFGISPFGVWRNRQQDPQGSNTTAAQTSYDGLYADVRKWLKEEWVDYVAPQLYWSTEHPTAQYDQLLPWWAENSFGKHLYIGIAVFKAKQADRVAWKEPGQLPMQIEMNRNYPQVNGNIFYSANSFEGNPHGIEEVLRKDDFKFPALVPSMPWKDNVPPMAPVNLAHTSTVDFRSFTWKSPPAASDGEKPSYYVVYRIQGNQRIDLEDPRNIVAMPQSPRWIDIDFDPTKKYTYLITSVDRLHNESKTCAAVIINPVLER